MSETRTINAYHVILVLAVLLVLFGTWSLVSSGSEPRGVITLGIGFFLALGALSRIRKGKA